MTQLIVAYRILAKTPNIICLLKLYCLRCFRIYTVLWSSAWRNTGKICSTSVNRVDMREVFCAPAANRVKTHAKLGDVLHIAKDRLSCIEGFPQALTSAVARLKSVRLCLTVCNPTDALRYTPFMKYMNCHMFRAPRFHPQGIVTTEVYKPTCQYIPLRLRIIKVLKC